MSTVDCTPTLPSAPIKRLTDGEPDAVNWLVFDGRRFIPLAERPEGPITLHPVLAAQLLTGV